MPQSMPQGPMQSNFHKSNRKVQPGKAMGIFHLDNKRRKDNGDGMLWVVRQTGVRSVLS